MTNENVGLVDRDYGQCVEVNPSRQIRTRASSFNSIKGAFNRFRAGVLKFVLDEKVKRTLATPYNSFNYERKIDRSAKVIARLEEKIMILSRENVPNNYVDRRAIKLRKNMIDNLSYHAFSIYGSGYRIGLGNRDKVMAPGLEPDNSLQSAVSATTVPTPVATTPAATVPTPVATTPAATVPTPVATTPAATVPTPVATTPAATVPAPVATAPAATVPAPVATAPAATVPTPVATAPAATVPTPVATAPAATVPAPVVTDPVVMAPEAVTTIPDGSIPFAAVTVPQEALPVPASTAPLDLDETGIDLESGPLNREDIADIINSSFDAVNSDEISASDSSAPPTETFEGELPVIDREAFRAALDEAFAQLGDESPVVQGDPDAISVDAQSEDTRISRNNVSAVHSEQFDENGERVERRKKYSYTPMTDEEIRAAQVNLGMDEQGNYVEGQEPVVSKANVVGEFSMAPISFGDAFTPRQTLVPVDQPVRDVPVVAKDRSETSFDLGDETSLFELLPQAKEDEATFSETAESTSAITSAESTSSMTSADYIALRDKMIELKKRQEESKKHKEEAQRRAQQAAEEAQAAIVSYDQTQQAYHASIGKLHSYIESLEAECDENERGITEAETEAREREDLARSKRDEADRTRQIISEINEMMGEFSAGDTPITSSSVK